MCRGQRPCPRGRCRADAGEHRGDRGDDPAHEPLRPVRRHGRREAGRGGRGHHPVGDERLDQPVGGRHAGQPRARWRSRPTSPRTCCRGSRWASRPRSPSAPCRASTTAAGSARSSRWATGPGGRSRSRSRSSTPTSSLFPELVATVHFLPDKALNNPNAEPIVPVRPQGGRVRGERPRLRLGRRRQVAGSPDDRSRSPSPTTTWRASRRGSRRASRSSLNPPRRLRDERRVGRRSPSERARRDRPRDHV